MRVARNNFPELLVLGPEQLKVIQEIKHFKNSALLGEAGCGKTFILLYLLYQNTAKCLRENECRKVIFAIPKQKIELKAFVEKFVEDFCNRNYAHTHSLDSFRDNITQDSELILFDEIYDLGYAVSSAELFHASAKIVVAVGLGDGMHFSEMPFLFSSEWTTFNLRSSYRNPSNIFSLCRKLRQLEYSKLDTHQLNMALDSSLKVNDEDSIQIKHIDYCSEVGTEIAERKEKTLFVADDENAFKSEFLNEYTLRVHVNSSDDKFSVQTLSFTGVQYKNVVILLMTCTNFIKETVLTLLYHSISRSTHRVILLTPNPDFHKFLLAATPVDLKVFEKLRRHQNVPKEDLLLLTNRRECCEALVLTVLTENWSMLDSLIKTFSSRPEAFILREDTIRFLIKVFPCIENGELLNIMSKNFSDEIDIQQMRKIYIKSGEIISQFPNVPGKRRLLKQFMELMPRRNLYADFFYLTKSKKWLEFSISGLIEASFIWNDRRMFMQLIEMTRNELHLFSRRLSELSSHLPENKRELFNWVELSPEKIMSFQQAEQVFTECSELTKNGKLKMSKRKFEDWITCCRIPTKLFSGSGKFRQTVKFAFCNFFRSFFRNFPYNYQNFLYFDLFHWKNIKDEDLLPTDKAIQLLEDFIDSNIGIEHRKSSIQVMSVLLARIYVLTSIEVNNPTTD